MGESFPMLAWTVMPMFISIGVAVLFVVLAVRLVRAVERIEDKLG